MKRVIARRVAGGAGGVLAVLLSANSSALAGGVNVTQHHNDSRRSGLYIDPAFTTSAAAGLTRDFSFNGTIGGSVFAQPLYIENGPGGTAMIIAVTESNNVYALNAIGGGVIWQTNVGTPAPEFSLLCTDIYPLGITGTPVVDLVTRSLFFDAMTTPDNGATLRRKIFSLNVDTGALNPGWPVDVNSVAKSGTLSFNSNAQGQRGALAIINGYLYVPYGGNFGDCGTYYGWLIGMPLNSPTNVSAWSTWASRGGVWSVGGVASDGLNPFIATGNTLGAGVWSGGEAIIRMQPGPVFSNAPPHYWAPVNWSSLDSNDKDIGGSGPLPVDVPGATPSQLIVALGKDGNAYLLNRTNLGGISAPVAQAHVSSSPIIQAAATYQTALGTHVVFRGVPVNCSDNDADLGCFTISAANPPAINMAWCAEQNGKGSPFVTTTDGTNAPIVWCVGAESGQRLRGFDGDTGAVVFAGGGTNELMTGTRRFSSGIVARGRIFVAADNKIYAFKLPAQPAAPFLLGNPAVLPNGAFQFSFSNTPGVSFSVYGSTNFATLQTNWTWLGGATEIAPGQFQFTDSSGTNRSLRLYRASSP